MTYYWLDQRKCKARQKVILGCTVTRLCSIAVIWHPPRLNMSCKLNESVFFTGGLKSFKNIRTKRGTKCTWSKRPSAFFSWNNSQSSPRPCIPQAIFWLCSDTTTMIFIVVAYLSLFVVVFLQQLYRLLAY